jgi:hypothetical protein
VPDEEFQVPVIRDEAQRWRPNTGQDPARRLIPYSNLYHKRPTLESASKVFTWPIGIEGLRRSGTAALGIHRYLGENSVDVQVLHKDESRIEMSGVFPGITGRQYMNSLIDVIMADTPERGKILHLPGVFPREQYVVVENYDFSHDEDDRTHSWTYTITFVRIEVGKRVKDPHGKPPPPQPGVKTNNRGKAGRIFTIKDGVRTLKAVAKLKYGDADDWRKLLNANRQTLRAYMGRHNISMHQLPTHRFPIGTKFRF